MSTHDFHVFHATPMLTGECPLWHQEENSLYWIDIPNCTIHRKHIESRAHRSWKLPTEPGCIARHELGGLIVAMRSGIAHFDTMSGNLTMLTDAPYDTTTTRFNDGRCDAYGRLWSGTMYEPRDQPLGSLYCFEHGVLRECPSPVTVFNGLAFSPDARTLYHSDTTAHAIYRFDYDSIKGEFAGKHTFMQFSKDKANNYGGRPDGAAVDSEGAYWVAMYEGGRVLRISPSGEILYELTLPVRCPTMVAFGGPNLRTLFITSASLNRPSQELASHPASGCILSIEVEVPGQLERAYKPA